jgi:hypothetical protein
VVELGRVAGPIPSPFPIAFVVMNDGLTSSLPLNIGIRFVPFLWEGIFCEAVDPFLVHIRDSISATFWHKNKSPATSHSGREEVEKAWLTSKFSS